MNARGLARPILAAGLAALAAARGARAREWTPAASPSETRNAVAAPGQPLAAILADLLYDPFVPLEAAESGGSLLVHYAVPLLDGSSAYMEFKSGSYIPCVPPGSGSPSPCGANAWSSQIWNVRKLVWSHGVLTTAWSFASDWKPVPAGGGVADWEPVFHPALAGDFLYVPGSSGTVYKLSTASGNVVARINPFGIPDNPT